MSFKSARTLVETYEDLDDIPTNRSTAPTLGDVITRRFSRRSILQGALATTAIAALGTPMFSRAAQAAKGGID